MEKELQPIVSFGLPRRLASSAERHSLECTYLVLGYQEGKQFQNGETVSDRRQSHQTFDGIMSSEKWQFSTTNVSMDAKAGGSRAVYKGKDHEDGNGARTVHGPISIS